LDLIAILKLFWLCPKSKCRQ